MATSPVRRYRVLDLSYMEEFFRDIEMQHQVQHVVPQAPRLEPSSETSSEVQPQDCGLVSDVSSENLILFSSDEDDGDDGDDEDSEDSKDGYRVSIEDTDADNVRPVLADDWHNSEDEFQSLLYEMRSDCESSDSSVSYSEEEDSEDSELSGKPNNHYRVFIDTSDEEEEFQELFPDGSEDESLSDESDREGPGEPESDFTSSTYSSSSSIYSGTTAEYVEDILPSDERVCEPESNRESITYSSSSSIDSIFLAIYLEDTEATMRPVTQRAQNRRKKKNIFRMFFEFIRKLLRR